jgi:transcriptional regulator with XRE-family HTH domain
MGLQQLFMSNLRKHRKSSGYTQEKLAEICNTDPCYIRQIEIGRRFPSIKYIERIAEALKIPPYRLFFEETNLENERLLSLYTEKKTEN